MNPTSSIQNVAILANPKAGNGKALASANWLSNALNDLQISSTIYTSNWPESNELNNYTDCWIIGGDGTINFFINKYPNCNIPLALFNGGTGNDFAWKLYGHSNLKERFEQVINATAKPIDVGMVNEKLYINCMGVGFDGEIIKSMKTIRFLGGQLGYLVAVLLKILNFKEPLLSIETNGKTFNHKYLLALVVNSSRAGGGFYIAPPAEVNDGKLNMVLCEALPVWKRLFYLPIIKSGKHMHLPIVKHELGSNFKIACEEEMPIQVDGELIFSKNILVKCFAGKFLFRY
jgi:YegS/Rv2252/BmrU family lipid kinase